MAAAETYSTRAILGAEIPSVVDRYQIRGVLGKGGMGAVYLGYDLKLGREVAIKVLRKEKENSEKLRERFHREARAIAKLHHPNIIELLDYSGPESDTLYLIMERLHGRSLDQAVSDKLLPEAMAAAIGYELADALAHAHQIGIIHRDIKPENVFIEPSGRVVITDFGIAKGVNVVDAGQTFAARPTKVIGTPLFASLEQLASPHLLCAQSDLYSLGCVLYNAVSFKFPHQADNLFDLMQALNRQTPVALKREAKVSNEYNALVMSLLERDIGKRPASAREVQKALRPILERAKIFDVRGAIREYWDEAVSLVARDNALESEATRVGTPSSLQSTGALPAPESATVVVQPPQAPSSATSPVTLQRSSRPFSPGRRSSRRATWMAAGIVATAVCASLVLALVSRGPKSSETVTVVPQPTPPKPPAIPAPPPKTAISTQPADTADSNQLGTVDIVVRPAGTIVIDGQPRGRYPDLTHMSLPVGLHVLRIENPDFAPRETSILVPPTGAAIVIVDLTNGTVEKR